jgi:hypothetical protein
MQIPCVYLPGPAPAVTVANNYFYLLDTHPWIKSILISSSSVRLPGSKYIEESLSILKNSTNILSTAKILTVSIKTSMSGFMPKKTTKKITSHYYHLKGTVARDLASGFLHEWTQ